MLDLAVINLPVLNEKQMAIVLLSAGSASVDEWMEHQMPRNKLQGPYDDTNHVLAITIEAHVPIRVTHDSKRPV